MRPPQFLPTLTFCLAVSGELFIICFYSMGLPHAVLAVPLLWISDQATAHSTSYRKPLVWTYRTRTMTQKTQASLQAANSMAW